MNAVAVLLLLIAVAVAVHVAVWHLRRVVILRYMRIYSIGWDEAEQLADRDNWWLRATWREQIRAAFRRWK